jgi:hypothetical protein
MTSKEFITKIFHARSQEERLELVDRLFKEGADQQRMSDSVWHGERQAVECPCNVCDNSLVEMPK